MGERRRRARLLMACIRGDDATAHSLAPEIVDHDRLVEVALEHKVVGFLNQRLRSVDACAPSLRRDLARRDIINRQGHRQVHDALAVVSVLFDDAAIGWAVVKGPAIASAYEDPLLRRAGDLDLLVAPHAFSRAVELLEAAGYTVVNRNWTLLHRVRSGQLQLQAPDGTAVDLHWHLLHDQVERDRFPIVTSELLGRRRRIQIGDLEVPTLDPTDALIHLAYHAAREGGDRLGWLIDIDRAITTWGLDTQQLHERARRWRLALPVALMLQRSARALGTDVPETALSLLAPRPWRALVAALDRSFPVASSTLRVGTLPSLLAKSAAQETTAGKALARAVRGLAGRSINAVRRVRLARTPLVRPPRDPEGLHFDSGGPELRASYLADVHRWES